MADPSRTLEAVPLSASSGNTMQFDDIRALNPTVTEGLHGWELLTAVLAGFVAQCRKEGRNVTDLMLQEYARQCLYGCDDAWNQTRADDEQWLALFKRHQGLGEPSELSSTAIGINGTMTDTASTLATLGADLGPKAASPVPASHEAVPTWDEHCLQDFEMGYYIADEHSTIDGFS